MRIFTQGGTRAPHPFLEDYPASLGAAAGASAQEGWVRSPGPSLRRMIELRHAQYGDTSADRDYPPIHPLSQEVLSRVRPTTEPEELSDMIPADEARAMIQELGYEGLPIPDEGIREDALEILVERKYQERLRQSVMARAPGGIGSTAVLFGASLAGSAADPLNVAAVLIPGVGQARYVQQLAQTATTLGRMGLRSRYGAVQGTVGFAAVEPIVVAGARHEGADYGLMDSFLNLTIGTVLGASLHTGFGATADFFRRSAVTQPDGVVTTPEGTPIPETARRVATYSPEDRRTLLQYALGQAHAGRRVDMDPMVNFMESVQHVRPASLDAARRAVFREEVTRIREALQLEAEPRLPRGQRQQIEQDIRGIEQELGRVDGNFRDRVRTLQRDEGLRRRDAERRIQETDQQQRRELEARRDELQGRLDADESARASQADLSRLEQGVIPARFRESIELKARQRLDAGRMEPVDSRIRQVDQTFPDANLQQNWNALREAALREGGPGTPWGAEPNTVSRINAELAEQTRRQPGTVEQARREVSELTEEIRQLEQQLGEELLAGETLLPTAQTEALDAAIARSDLYRRGLDAFNACQARRGG